MLPKRRNSRYKCIHQRNPKSLVTGLLIVASLLWVVFWSNGGDDGINPHISDYSLGVVEALVNQTKASDSAQTQSDTGTKQKIPSSSYSFDPTTGQISNLHVILVGDSLSRYVYLSLVHWVHTSGNWVPEGDQLLEKVKDSSPGAWNSWLAYTNQRFEGAEDCDCYRHWKDPFKWYKHCENRYYRDLSGKNNTVTFITKFGGNPFHGHWRPGQELTPSSTTGRPGLNQTLRKYEWVYKTWDELIHEYISKLHPKPSIMLFNQGHWKAHELRDTSVLQALQQALEQEQIRGIYRTTTFRSDEPNYQDFANLSTRRHDFGVCQTPGLECLNVSWTADTPPEDYIDPVHFKAPLTNQMTYQFLVESLGLEGVQAPPLSSFSQQKTNKKVP